MKKNVLKLFFLLFIVFCYIENVDAGLIMCNPEYQVTVEKAGIKTEEYTVKVPYCYIDRSKGPNASPTHEAVGAATSAEGAKSSAITLVTAWTEDADGKGIHLTEYPVCDLEDGQTDYRKIKATSECSYYYYTTATKTNKTEKQCVGGTLDPQSGKCIGGEMKDVVVGCSFSCSSGSLIGTSTGACTESRSCKVTGSYDVENEMDFAAATDINAEALCNSAKGVTTCTCTAPVYELMCPRYKCETRYKNISACNQTFYYNDSPAYCINPSDGFTVGDNNYEIDPDFDLYKCVNSDGTPNSYLTPECGYANILIEGRYYNVPSAAINIALRLWGVHTNRQGFDKSGLAYLYATDDNGVCNKPIYYMPVNGEFINIYKVTHDYIMSEFYEIAKKYDYIPDNEIEMTGYDGDTTRGKTFEEVSCDLSLDRRGLLTPASMGIMCGSSKTYRIAYELYFNTLIGNKYMFSHLSDDYNFVPIGARIISEDRFDESTTTRQIVSVTYDREDYWENVQGEEIDCTKLDQMVADGIIDEATKEKIKPLCSVTVTLVDEDGNPIVLYDPDGNLIPGAELIIEKCMKGTGCTTKEFSLAVCDYYKHYGKEIEIVVGYDRTESSWAVKRLVSCGSGENQQMFTIETGGESHDEPFDTRTEKPFAVTNYICDGGCDDFSTTKPNKVCSDPKNMDNFDNYYETSVKDPSLKCIANAKDAGNKTKYDYSKYFGVNTNFCRIYCSDEVNYKLADKVKGKSGRGFKYNIGIKIAEDKVDPMLSSVVVESRNCVSEIYYQQLPKDVDWATTYGLTKDEVTALEKDFTFTGLYKILYNKKYNSGDVNEQRTEVINQLIYDMYNCNLYNRASMSKYVDTPRQYKRTINGVEYETTSDYISAIYSANNNYGLDTYSDGTTKLPNNSYKNNGSVSYNVSPIDEETQQPISPVNTSSKIIFNLSNVTYCNGVECLSYSSTDKDSNYDYSTGGDRRNLLKTFDFRYYYKGYHTTKVNVPVNDYAFFKIDVEYDFYKDQKYRIVPNSGNLLTIKPGQDKHPEYLLDDIYNYPLSFNAYNYSSTTEPVHHYSEGEKDKVTNYNRYNVNQNIKVVNFYRNNTNDEFINEIKNNIFTCYVDVSTPGSCDKSTQTCSGEYGTLYRNVDLSKLFPSTNTGVCKDNPELKDLCSGYTNTNWNNSKIISSIQHSADKLLTEKDENGNLEYLDYSIELTPTNIKNIKEYNKLNGTYLKEGFVETEDIKCTINKEEGTVKECYSVFLDVLRNQSKESSGEYGTITPSDILLKKDDSE